MVSAEEPCAALQEFLLQHADGDILDCGCGTGETLRWLYTHRPGRLIGVDTSTEKVNQAFEALTEDQVPDKRIDYEIMDLEQMAFKDGQFDTAIMTDAIQYVTHPLRALAEIHRVLKTDGKLLLAITVGEQRLLHFGNFDVARIPELVGQRFTIQYIEERGGVVQLVAIKQGGKLRQVLE